MGQCSYCDLCQKEKESFLAYLPGCEDCVSSNNGNKPTVQLIRLTETEKRQFEDEIISTNRNYNNENNILKKNTNNTSNINNNMNTSIINININTSNNNINNNVNNNINRQNSQLQKEKKTEIANQSDQVNNSPIPISSTLFIKELKDLPEKKYVIKKELGQGSYGVVYLVENIFTKEQVAMKKIPKTTEDLLTDTEVMDEIEILKTLDHPDIVKLNEFYSTKDNYYIINEYCSGGELYDIIDNEYSETEIAVIFRQIFSGLAYLHSNNIFHRDLKLENILIYDTEIVDDLKLYDIKIIDFGTAKIFDKNQTARAIVGSSYYIAPEVLNKQYSKECDLWSAGVILYMFIVGHAPFDGDTDSLIIKKVKKGKYQKNEERWKKSSKEVRDLITKLLVYEPENRLTAEEALKHPWFDKVNSGIFYNNISKEDIIKCIKNLLSYGIKSKFEELVWAYIIHNLPRPKEAKNAIKLFKMANKNGDGKLLRSELKETLLNFVSSYFIKNFDAIFDLLDSDNNGYIDYEEFLRACIDRNKVITESVLKYAFSFFDKENSGYINKNIIKSYFVKAKLTEKQFMNIFNEIDTNGDGRIDFKEFRKMMLY